MSLSDIMSKAGLHIWAEMALVIFFAVFVGILIYLFVRKRKSWDHTRHLPLEDGDSVAPEDRRR